MKEYTVIFKEGKDERINCADKKDLIKLRFDGDEDKFKKEVKRLIWSTTAMHYTEEVETGEVESQVISADVNPYGWRNR